MGLISRTSLTRRPRRRSPQSEAQGVSAAVAAPARPRWAAHLGTGGIVIALVLTLLSLLPLRSLLAIDFFHSNAGHDFLLLYAAARALRMHQNPYNAHVFISQALAAGVPRIYLLTSGRLDQPFVYPPLFAWLVIPLTTLPPKTALLAWRVLSLACVFAGTLGLLASWAEGDNGLLFSGQLNRALLAAIVTVAPVSLYAVYWGNPVVLVYAAMGCWVWALSRNRVWADLLAGATMAVALLKPQLALPLALLAALLFTQGATAWSRRRHIAFGLGSACLALLALDLATTGPALLLAWPQAVRGLSGLIYEQPDMPSLLGLLRPMLLQAPVPIQVPAFCIMVGGALFTSWLYLRLCRRWPLSATFGVLTVVACFATPYAHANDVLLLVPGGLTFLSQTLKAPAVLSAVNRLARQPPPGSVPGRLEMSVAKLYGVVGMCWLSLAPIGLILLWRGGVIYWDLLSLQYILPWLSVDTLAPLALLGCVALFVFFERRLHALAHARSVSATALLGASDVGWM